MNSAIRPPSRKNVNDVTMYITPIFLWSTVVSHSYARERYAGRAWGSAVVAISGSLR